MLLIQDERPDDDLIEVETCSLNIQENLTCLTYVVILYINPQCMFVSTVIVRLKSSFFWDTASRQRIGARRFETT